MTTKLEHLNWLTKRASEYYNLGLYVQGLASVISDLGKHPETAGHPIIGMLQRLLSAGPSDDELKTALGLIIAANELSQPKERGLDGKSS